MDLFYHPELILNSTYSLSEEESRHITKSKRYKEGDVLNLTDGKGTLAEAVLSLPSKRSASIVVQKVERSPSREFNLTVAISPLRSPARWEWFIEKASEMGVSCIQPIACERTVKDHYKKERLRKMMISAMKQSQRSYLPELREKKSFKDHIESEKAAQLFVAHCEEDKKSELIDSMKPSLDTCVLVGPEGDFTPEEIQLAIQSGYTPVSLGKFRLRAETAGLVVCQNFNFVNRL